MLRRLLGFPVAKSKALGPAGKRAYAIGDIHGRLDLMVHLLNKIEEDNRARGPAETYVIFLGDLVDRGPESKGVINHLLEHGVPFARPIFLKGNHEELFLDVLGGKEDLVPTWLTYGGQECVDSYGISRGATLNMTSAALVERLRRAVPEGHQNFIKQMFDTFQFGDYLFVHAGIRPGMPLEEQSGGDLRWIREGFLESQDDHGVMVVHGHTIVDKPEEHPNRTALDTGAFRTGVLSAMGIDGHTTWFIEAQGSIG